ncbi:6-hydroxymethylpterin diphosphokinase MptE-like protein [Ruegeria atlantica]|uniref:6-hydroxymethylpterin diphosphokinase MptE-like protein n=1 Tax=Ruegeria atlantica TaxID=81569 RepID=UPI00147E4AD2|nr:6-hydroxymethylpterin diphosphokinase MptE-like protein [Ruegeria atlantica]
MDEKQGKNTSSTKLARLLFGKGRTSTYLPGADVRLLKSIEAKLSKLENIEKNLKKLQSDLNRKIPEIAPRMIKSTPDKFKEIEGKFSGQRCFLLGTAPSLSKLDFAALRGEKVITVNGGLNLLGNQLDNICGYVVADPVFYRDYNHEIDISRIDHTFINSTANITNPVHLKEAFIFDSYKQPKMHEGAFQFDLTQPVFSSHTVMHVAIQIAVYMGFTSINIAGVDLSFGGKNPHFYDSNRREISDSESRSKKNAEKMFLGFERANKILQERGIKLYNLSKAGSLDCIERVDLRHALAKTS